MTTKKTIAAKLLSIAFLTLAFVTLPILTGCQQTPLEGETYRKVAVAWPLFDFEKTRGTNPDGSTWKKEKGNAICWLQTWEKHAIYDKDGYVISRKEKDTFFPLFSDEIEETKEYRIHKGSVLIFPFYSRQTKQAD